jgi:hypothetical protein
MSTHDSRSSVRKLGCTLSDDALNHRLSELRRTLGAAVQETRELPDGYALRFSGDDASARQLVDFVTFERRCCGTFIYELVFDPNQGPIWLRIRGDDGAPALLREALANLAVPLDDARTP